MAIRIVIAEDNSFLIKVVAEKLSFFDELQLKYTALNGDDLIQKLEKDPIVDVVLMDIEMPIVNGIEATERIKQKYPQIKVIMLTVFDDDENIFKAIQAGADGYLLKEVNARDLYNGIHETMEGGAAMTPSIAMKTLKLLRNPIALEPHKELESVRLSVREIQVLEQLSKGLSYNAIAENLIVSSGTIRKHVENIYKKLRVHNKLEAVQKARRHNLI
ncbi:response regulator transcription factor [Aestuariivivens sediminicola]|uniref:response regulator transcription factor n=1 Tax=Aestuariivivens sediminicola TaxID=2913560 RepID=UPI001F5A0B09|nr:response regulator transcription factor [Aestuariivivens sediminicola]